MIDVSAGTSLPARLTRAALGVAVRDLTMRDRGLAAIVDRHGPPPLWARSAGFATLARIVLEQQVSLASAAALYRRLERQIPGGFTPSAIDAAGPAGLRALGVTRQKASYLTALAGRIVSGTFDLRALARLTDADGAALLQQESGIGPWTAHIYLLMALRRPDVWPPGDLALHKALGELHRLEQTPTSDEAARFARRWAPHRAVAARILWHGYLSRRQETARRPAT